jgi:hypothetical protein
MAGVSVLGANVQSHKLDYYATNLELARKLADKINAGVSGGFIIAADNNTAPTIGQSVMAGAANPAYRNDHQNASGTIVFGNGQDKVDIGARDAGAWIISVGNGQDTISVQGPGAATISAGLGGDSIKLGTGKSVVHTSGQATVVGGSGAATVSGGTGLSFIGGGGDAMVTGAQGSDNSFQAGSGNETLTGGAFRGHGSDTFVFSKSHAGGQDIITNFTPGQDEVILKGYSEKELQAALLSAQTIPAGTTITLSDDTKITFNDLYWLDPKSFVIK